ncbi:hypothetical protein A7L73_18930 [Acinetobacter baumannii]|nr:hypothetical protein A7L73_18930 [Acinetobacter baumannii]
MHTSTSPRPFLLSSSSTLPRYHQRRPSSWTSLHGFAVGGGADLVRHADAALSGEAGGEVEVDPLDAAGSRLQAPARGLAVRGGPGRGVEGLHAGAAGAGQGARAPQVADAGAHAGGDLGARDGRASRR